MTPFEDSEDSEEVWKWTWHLKHILYLFKHFIATIALCLEKVMWIYSGKLKTICHQKIINVMYTHDKTKLPGPLVKEILDKVFGKY